MPTPWLHLGGGDPGRPSPGQESASCGFGRYSSTSTSPCSSDALFLAPLWLSVVE